MISIAYSNSRRRHCPYNRERDRVASDLDGLAFMRHHARLGRRQQLLRPPRRQRRRVQQRRRGQIPDTAGDVRGGRRGRQLRKRRRERRGQ